MLVLQLLLLCLVLQSREQLKITLEILLSILYLDLLRKRKQRRSWIWFPIHYRWSCRIQDQQSTRKHRHLCCWWKQSRILYSSNRSWICLSSLLVDLSKASPSTKQQLVFIRSVVRLYSTMSSALLVLDLYSLLAEQQNPRPPTNQKAQFCLLHLELEQSCYSQRSICRWNFIYLLWSALIERVAVAEEDTTLYTFSGAVEFIYRVRYPGSGTINLLSGAAEAAAVAEESTGLYEFQGSKDESFTPAPYIGSGSYGGFSGTKFPRNIPKHTSNHTTICR